MSKKKKTKEPKRRKIGERVETVDVRLTPMQIEDARARVIDLIQEKDELEEQLKSSKADYKAKIAEVDSKKAAELGAIRTGRVRREMVIEEWVTDRNEVIRVDKATGEEIGRRTATPRELQEDLPIDTTPPATEEKGAEDELEDEVAEDEDEDADEFGDR